MKRTRTRALLGCLALTTAVAVAGCGGDITNAGSSEDCEPFDMAVNPWVGYESNAHVVGRIAETQLGCRVNYVDLDEQTSWKGFGTDEVDVIIENWGHEDLVKKYVDGDKTAQLAGYTGVDGTIGWYVPPWMAEEYPDITDWKNLNKYADLFETTESGDKGQLLDGDPGYVTYDEALVENLDLDYEVVVGGSEAALIEAFRSAQENKTPLLAYFYRPQWFFNEIELAHVELPAYTPGCDAVPSEVDCDYPPYRLNKVVATDFAESGSPAYDLVTSFKWTEEDQNVVSKYISEDGMEPDAAADRWIADNQDMVDVWLDK
ncbi:MAG: ABC transporter substrate-binding protein [Propionibacteriales bacterium]|nr:ABC transporter substrate-binding protein [Propionibacteriales bacterium]